MTGADLRAIEPPAAILLIFVHSKGGGQRRESNALPLAKSPARQDRPLRGL